MNTQIRRGRLAALVLTGAVAGVVFLPLGVGVASASAGFPAVQAGGPPSEPVRHVTKYVPREKPVLHNPRYHMPRIDVIVHNDNYSRNERHHERLKHEPVKHEPVKEEPVKEEPIKDEPIKDDKVDNDKWWWPNLD
ncbi:hypothetical protein GCM10009850_108070 [Nonomuraea monospora]|uniref:Secreted protein n=1 Tax=Nonomuraea monospora TaxID=568818 RepID=A0ABN3D0N5_9ACTN